MCPIAISHFPSTQMLIQGHMLYAIIPPPHNCYAMESVLHFIKVEIKLESIWRVSEEVHLNGRKENIFKRGRHIILNLEGK